MSICLNILMINYLIANDNETFKNIIAGRKFKEFVQTALDKREKDFLINKGLNVTSIPEIVKIFLKLQKCFIQ